MIGYHQISLKIVSLLNLKHIHHTVISLKIRTAEEKGN